MYIGKSSIRINGGRPAVYKVATTYPNFVSFFLEGSRRLLQDESTIQVEVHSKLLGLKTKWQGVGQKRFARSIRFIQTQGLFKGLTARWSFVGIGKEETKVSICTSFRKPLLSPLGELLVGRFLVERITSKILNELQRQCEIDQLQAKRITKV